jgi:hypothetical protein
LGASAPAEVRAGETELEAVVSETIGRMEAVLLPIEDDGVARGNEHVRLAAYAIGRKLGKLRHTGGAPAT